MEDDEAVKIGNVDFFLEQKGYALYRYHANRAMEPKKSQDGNNSSKETSVPEFLQKEATLDNNFSLTVLFTSLPVELEAQLRNFVAKRLSKGTFYSGSGHISTVDLLNGNTNEVTSLSCYYTLLRHEAKPEGISSIADDIRSAISNEFVICFIAPHESNLDLFKPEIDVFCNGLQTRMEVDPILQYELEDSTECVAAALWKPELCEWYERCVCYIVRGVSSLKSDIKYLIYAALVGMEVKVETEDKDIASIIQKLVDSFSLSNLLAQCDKSSSQAKSNSDDMVDCKLIPTPVLTVFEDNGDFRFSSQQWAGSLVGGDVTSATYLRQVVENYKLKAIQDLNTMKRCLRLAETDHYSLYKAYVFIRQSGNCPILLTQLATECSNSQSMSLVLEALQNFISQKEK